MRRSTSLALASLVLIGIAAGCGDDDDTPAAPETTASIEITASTASPSSIASGVGRTFTFSTADGTLVVAGEAESCTSPDETTLQVTVEGEDGRFELDVTDGSGSVRVTASGTEFEGTVTSLQIDDAGEVTAAGRGSVADDSATGGATDFTVTGACPDTRACDDRPMLITTSFDFPGYEITSIQGEIFGLTVRARNIGAGCIAGLRSIGGGEIPEFTQLLSQSRSEAMARMVEEARQLGSTAIIGMRFDSGAIGQWSEICAYGTGVTITPISDYAKQQFEYMISTGAMPQQGQYSTRISEWSSSSPTQVVPPAAGTVESITTSDP